MFYFVKQVGCFATSPKVDNAKRYLRSTWQKSPKVDNAKRYLRSTCKKSEVHVKSQKYM